MENIMSNRKNPTQQRVLLTGTYTCQLTGVYMINVNLVSANPIFAKADIYVDNVPVAGESRLLPFFCTTIFISFESLGNSYDMESYVYEIL